MEESSGCASPGEISLNAFYDEWQNMEAEYEALETKHTTYLGKLSEVHKLQNDCLKGVKSHLRKLNELRDSMRRLKLAGASDDSRARLGDLEGELTERKIRLSDMIEELPRESNGLYLSVILGSVNVSLMSKQDKFKYKDEYEKFKFVVTTVSLVVALLAYLFHARIVDAAFHFLLVWYYCTLTIRESILRINGSRIKGWWVAHHYLSTLLCGICLTWPDGECYQAFRKQFLVFSLYLSIVQILQCNYQRGCLYRLRALGQRHSMDITVEGFHSWMFKGLTFLLPFLILGYVFQLYNAYTLFKIYWRLGCPEWQVLSLSALFFLLSVGNAWTTWQVCWRKFQQQAKVGFRHRLETKYSSSPAADNERDGGEQGEREKAE